MNGSGSSPADPAMPMLHPQGQNRSQDPIGLSNLMSRKYGWTFLGQFSTNWANENLNAEEESDEKFEALRLSLNPKKEIHRFICIETYTDALQEIKPHRGVCIQTQIQKWTTIEKNKKRYKDTR